MLEGQGRVAARRRTPVQERSRGRVQDILTATGLLLAEGGVDAVTTRSIAERANISVAAIYQYFPNRDAIVDAYLEVGTSRVDVGVIEAVRALEIVSVRNVIEAVVLTHLRFYQENVDLVRVWLSARADSVVLRHARDRNAVIGKWLRDAFIAAGFLTEDIPIFGTELVVEVCTRVLEFAFSAPREPVEREEIARMGIEMAFSQIAVYMTESGFDGIPSEEFTAALGRVVTQPPDVQVPLDPPAAAS